MMTAASAGETAGRCCDTCSGTIEHLLGSHPDERQPSRQKLIAERADRIDVGAVIDQGIGHRLLGRHVRGRAQGNAHRRDGRFAGRVRQRLGHTKIRDEGVVSGQQHVVWLDVTMHDPVGVRV